MSGRLSGEALQGALCEGLQPEVADKLFQAPASDRFERRTAQAICGRCAVQLACLTSAILEDRESGIRGGEPPEAISVLRYQHRREGTPAVDLARRAISHQVLLEGRFGGLRLRAGHFADAALAFPELGGELIAADDAAEGGDSE